MCVGTTEGHLKPKGNQRIFNINSSTALSSENCISGLVALKRAVREKAPPGEEPKEYKASVRIQHS